MLMGKKACSLPEYSGIREEDYREKLFKQKNFLAERGLRPISTYDVQKENWVEANRNLS